MATAIDDEIADLRRMNAALRRSLDESTKERDEAVDQQTATSQILEIINSSVGNPVPVFEAILAKAHALCGATQGALVLFDGETFRANATRGLPEIFAKSLHAGFRASPESPQEKLASGERLVHIADVSKIDDPTAQRGFELAAIRTVLYVPLRKEDDLLGYIAASRQEIRPFTDKQITLFQNFAAQAVIAIENARLITETREALEQQTATAEVLGVINSSTGNITPVFETILEKAHALCGVEYGTLQLYDGEKFRAVAIRGGFAEPITELLRQPYAVEPNGPLRDLLDGGSLVEIPDILEHHAQAPNPRSEAAIAVGIRSLLFLALRRDSHVLGLISAGRRAAGPFSEKEIALLQNFAAQAVIAMENARLITETREALEQQTATAEVLQVINSSPGDLAPVFDAILEKAHRLCGTDFGALQLQDGSKFRSVAARGLADSLAELLRQPFEPVPGSPPSRLLSGERIVHLADMLELAQQRTVDERAQAVAEHGFRRGLFVPLRKDAELLGYIVALRQEVRPYSEKEIALLENFAAQAVIAIENARLITETREALEQQTATAEVLQVINSSPGDLAPVFDAMVERAAWLCEADEAALRTFDGELLHLCAVYGSESEVVETLQRLGPTRAFGLYEAFARGQRLVQFADVRETDVYHNDPVVRERLELRGIRTWLAVALQKEGVLLGVINVHRHAVRPFSDKQIALLENFAAQAVIAMENARLITETREALEQQTATAEVLQVINSSPGDLAPVFDAMLEKAMRLCEAAFGFLATYDGECFHHVAGRGLPPAFADRLREPWSPGAGTAALRVVRGEAFVHIADLIEDQGTREGASTRRAMIEIGGARTQLTVPLRKDNALLGNFVIYRQEVRPFTDKQIALLQNFAAQAVIAMENARLITETREALEQQTATAEVLQVINSSPGDLPPVFDAILEKAHGLCGVTYGSLQVYDGEHFQAVAVRGLPAALANRLRQGYRGSDTPASRPIVEGERVVQITDLGEIDHPMARRAVELAGIRTLLSVALHKDDALLGMIVAGRREVRPFAEKEIALLQNFAAQAVIAMENARLLDEIRQRQSELRVTFDNMADGVVMFDEDLRLAAWNRNFQELLDLPDAVLAARTSYADYLRILAERGEFGTEDVEAELSRRLEHTDQELRLERTRPDGRVLEVRRNAVAGGGFVLIYSDITERKRSEAEIRAAKDAAEAAYRDLKAAQASLVQAEKMASLGQLTAGIAHEIKNPLNFVNNFAGLSVELLDELKETAAPAITALDEDKRAEIDETIEMLTGNLEKIAEHGRRADNIVKSMLEHSRGSSGERRSVDLNGLIEEALNLAYHGARAQDQSFNITLERDFAEAMPPIELVPQDITRVCLNLFSNGFYAASKRQNEQGDLKFKPTLKVSTCELGEAVEIRIRDNGIGIPPEIRDKLFQPFFTTKPTGEGTGLGLSISYDIVTQQHGGTIAVDSRVGEFTEFTVRLPRTHRAAMAEAAS